MGQTMVEKIVSRQVGRKVATGEKIERLPITKLFFNDVIGPPAILGFRDNFTEVFARHGKVPQIFDPQRVFFLPDHSVPAFSIQIAEGVKLMKEFAKETGAKMFKEGDGIEHVVLIEDGQIAPLVSVCESVPRTISHGTIWPSSMGKTCSLPSLSLYILAPVSLANSFMSLTPSAI